jgi:hypothetical protein
VYRARVRPGTYLIFFGPGCGNTGNWLVQWFTNGKFPYKPERVVVRAGRTDRVSAKLTLGGEITGRVTGAGGRLLSGVCVQLVPVHSGYVASPFRNEDVTITNGKPFKLTSVQAMRYRIQFSTTSCGNTGNYANQFWHDALSMRTATVLTVRPGKVVSGIAQRLPAGAVVTGQVTAQGGGPLAGICVDFDGSGWVPPLTITATTGSDGRYRAKALSTGKYSVEFDPTCGGAISSPYQVQGYPVKVAVRNGKTTTGIDASLST